MRLPVFVLALSVSTFATAQQRTEPQEPQQQLDKQTQERLRVERAAGGVRQVTPEEKASADAGAGPHITRPKSGQSSKRVDDKGTARGEGVGAGAGSTAR